MLEKQTKQYSVIYQPVWTLKKKNQVTGNIFSFSNLIKKKLKLSFESTKFSSYQLLQFRIAPLLRLVGWIFTKRIQISVVWTPSRKVVQESQLINQLDLSQIVPLFLQSSNKQCIITITNLPSLEGKLVSPLRTAKVEVYYRMHHLWNAKLDITYEIM